MSLDDELRRAGARLNAELEQVPVPQPPRGMGRLKVLAIAAVVTVTVIGATLWLTRTTASTTPVAPVVTTAVPASTTTTTTEPAPVLTTTQANNVIPSTPQEAAAIGGWTPIADGLWAYPHTVRGWTGTDLLVFPEYAYGLEAPTTGMAYRPANNTWRELTPIPELRGDPAAVWTGSSLIVWGGTVADTTDGYILSNTGFAYDPAADSWSTIPPAPLDPQTGPLCIWTGQEMIIWGGATVVDDIFLNATNSGAAYNPTTGEWRVLPESPVVPSISGARIVAWTGTEMIIGGDRSDMDSDGSWGAYDPSTDSWRVLPEPPGSDVLVQNGVWTGTQLVVGINRNTVYPSQSDLYVLDPETNQWGTATPPGTSISQAGTAWTGTYIVYWGAVGSSEESFIPSVYQPADDTWRPLTDGPLDYRFGYETLTAISPTTMLIWGGQNYDAQFFFDGAILTVDDA